MLTATPDIKTNKRALLILGMHRSGTSALTRVCNLLGAELGSDLMAAAVENNEAGFWEHNEIVRLHDRLLLTLGSNWNDPEFLPDNWWGKEEILPFYEELKTLIQRDFANAPLWGIKDPRICRLLPLWYKILADLDIEPLAVIALRHPLNVSSSLKKRDNFTLVKSLLVWLQHFIAAGQDSRGHKRVFVHYDALLENPEAISNTIAERLDFTWPVAYKTAGAEIEQFLNPSLRHHNDSASQPIPEGAIRHLITEALDIIASIDSDSESVIEEKFAALRLHLETLLTHERGIYSFWHDEALTSRAAIVQQVGALEADLTETQTLLHRKNLEQIAANNTFQQLLTERETELHQRNLAYLEAQEKLDSTHAKLDSTHAKLDSTHAKLHETAETLTSTLHRVDALTAAMDDKSRQLQCTEAELAGARHTILSILNSSSWKITAPLRKFKTFAAPLYKTAISVVKPTTYVRIATLFRNYGAAKVYKKTLMVLKTQGIRGIIHYMNRNVAYELPNYQKWIKEYDTLSATDRKSIRHHIEQFPHKPLISVLMPVYNVDIIWLRAAIDSVLTQLYPHWELCIADDCSTDPQIKKTLKEYSKKDNRIKVVFREKNGHISESSNSALALCSGEFVALLDHDDMLPEQALYYVAYEINKHPELDLIYSDEDKLAANGTRYDPYFKSDWNPDLFYGQNMFSHLGVYRHSLLQKIGGFRKGYEGSQDYDLCLRCLKETSADKVRHIPHILYHWRAIEGSTALSIDSKDYAGNAAAKALQDFFTTEHPGVKVDDAAGGGYHRLHWPIADPTPKVTLIIPTRNALHLLSKCVNSILQLTDYANYDIIIMNNQSDDPETLAYFEHLSTSTHNVRVVNYDAPFNFSSINNAAVATIDSPIIGLINNDIEVIHADWLKELVSHALRKDVGAVGAKLYYPNNTVQHGGVITGTGAHTHAVATHLFHGLTKEAPGYFGRAWLAQSLSGVTAACLVMRREVFHEVGGFEEKHLTIAFNDVDLCLKIREKGYRIIWTPYAELYHHESATRGYEDTPEKFARFQKEVAYMRNRWGDVLDNDPYYNPNLELLRGDFSLAFPPRAKKPWLMWQGEV